jgi:hypothetical protein
MSTKKRVKRTCEVYINITYIAEIQDDMFGIHEIRIITDRTLPFMDEQMILQHLEQSYGAGYMMDSLVTFTQDATLIPRGNNRKKIMLSPVGSG